MIFNSITFIVSPPDLAPSNITSWLYENALGTFGKSSLYVCPSQNNPDGSFYLLSRYK